MSVPALPCRLRCPLRAPRTPRFFGRFLPPLFCGQPPGVSTAALRPAPPHLRARPELLPGPQTFPCSPGNPSPALSSGPRAPVALSRAPVGLPGLHPQYPPITPSRGRARCARRWVPASRVAALSPVTPPGWGTTNGTSGARSRRGPRGARPGPSHLHPPAPPRPGESGPPRPFCRGSRADSY